MLPHELALEELPMLKRLLTALFIPALACATVIAQELSPTHLHQPTLTPQNSGTTNGLVVLARLPSLLTADRRGEPASCPAPKRCNFAMCRPSAPALLI
jgi:hypothetical protein